ncbi:MAG: PilZ domain-containing protein [Bdellovibrionaceae bacterium]|nr:PilZ domain-containing protein [Pseudobdellovibrionaceae bacterium]
MKIYFLSDGNRKIGPFSAEDVTKMLFNCQINMLDQVFNSESNEWVPVTSLQEDAATPRRAARPSSKTAIPGLTNTGVAEVEDDEYSGVIGLVDHGLGGQRAGTNPGVSSGSSTDAGPKGSAPKPALKQSIQLPLKQASKAAPSISQTDRWLAKEGRVTLGPYSFITILGMILDGTIREHDQLKIVDKTDWAPASSYEQFKVEILKGIQIESAQKIAERGGFKRKSARLDVKELIAVSAGDTIQHTIMGDISTGGCSLIPNYPMFKKGDTIYLSIFHGPAKADEPIEFNAQGTVLNVFKHESKYDEYYKHSIQFTAMTEDLLKEINGKMVK